MDYKVHLLAQKHIPDLAILSNPHQWLSGLLDTSSSAVDTHPGLSGLIRHSSSNGIESNMCHRISGVSMTFSIVDFAHLYCVLEGRIKGGQLNRSSFN